MDRKIDRQRGKKREGERKRERVPHSFTQQAQCDRPLLTSMSVSSISI